jgi:hypothetical protein
MSETDVVKPKWSMRRKILVALLILPCISLLVVMPTLTWELHGANKALRSFTDALVAKQYRSAYSSTSREFQASVDFQTFVKVQDGLTIRMGDLNGVAVTLSEVKERSDGWYGTAETTMNFAHGNLDFTYILRKNDGQWKVYSYREE